MKSDNFTYEILFLLVVVSWFVIYAFAYMMGFQSGLDNQPSRNVDRAFFGFYQNDSAWKEYPHCQTDMEMSTAWTADLMYLNGVWTAACVAETLRQKDIDDAKTK